MGGQILPGSLWTPPPALETPPGSPSVGGISRLPPLPFSELLSRGSRVLGEEVLGDPHTLDLRGGREGDRDRSRLGGRETEKPGQWKAEAWVGEGGPWWAAHTHAHRHAHGPRPEFKFWGHTRSQASPPAPQFPPCSAHLLGLGRGLGREAGAGTFKDPAVSVIRAHQLGRQASTWAVRAPRPCARASRPHPVPRDSETGPLLLRLFVELNPPLLLPL